MTSFNQGDTRYSFILNSRFWMTERTGAQFRVTFALRHLWMIPNVSAAFPIVSMKPWPTSCTSSLPNTYPCSRSLPLRSRMRSLLRGRKERKRLRPFRSSSTQSRILLPSDILHRIRYLSIYLNLCHFAKKGGVWSKLSGYPNTPEAW